MMLEVLAPLTRVQKASWSEGLVLIKSDQYDIGRLASSAVLAECGDDIDDTAARNAATYSLNSYPSVANPKLKEIGDQLFHEVVEILDVESEQNFALRRMDALTYSHSALDKSPHRDNFCGAQDGMRITVTLDNPGLLWWDGERSKNTVVNKDDVMVQQLHDAKARLHSVRRKDTSLPRSIFFWDYTVDKQHGL